MTGQKVSSVASRWALHKRLYLWIQSLAYKKYATFALFAVSFTESCFFPIVPDVLQIALSLERKAYTWFYATISSIASVLGGLLGYVIGAFLWQYVSDFFFAHIFSEATFKHVKDLYQRWDFLAVLFAAFTPIPYKIFTLAAGVCQISIPMFLIASILGRAGRFFLVATCLWHFGPAVKLYLERYFNLITLLLAGLLLVGYAMFHYM